MLIFWSNFRNLIIFNRATQHVPDSGDTGFEGPVASNRPSSELKRSWLGKRLLSHTNFCPYFTFSRFLGAWEVSRYDFQRLRCFFPVLKQILGYRGPHYDLLCSFRSNAMNLFLNPVLTILSVPIIETPQKVWVALYKYKGRNDNFMRRAEWSARHTNVWIITQK